MSEQLTLCVQRLGVSINAKTLLDDISVNVAPGEIHTVIGPNGAGKSTLLRCISGDISATNGQVFYFGQERKNWPARQLACRVASLPQQSHLNFPFSVSEVVAMSRLPHDTGRKNDNEIVEMLLEKLDIQHIAKTNYTHLSGGEKQRVQLARVIAQLFPLDDQPKLLVLDEPCSSLDLKHQKMLSDFLLQLRNQGVSIVVTVHDLNWAVTVSDAMLALKEARVLAQGEPETIIQTTVLQQLFDVSVAIYRGENSKQHRVSLL